MDTTLGQAAAKQRAIADSLRGEAMTSEELADFGDPFASAYENELDRLAAAAWRYNRTYVPTVDDADAQRCSELGGVCDRCA